MPSQRPKEGGRRIIPNRIFLAYPWTSYRKHYEAVCKSIHATLPVCFYAVGRDLGVESENLLEVIQSTINTATGAVFDISKGNPNVCFEYGLARAVLPLRPSLLVDETTLPTRSRRGSPIISDLAGLQHNRWTSSSRSTLKAQLTEIALNHPYTQRFLAFCRWNGIAGDSVKPFLKILRRFDGREEVLRNDLLDELGTEPYAPRREILEERLGILHKGKFVGMSAGRRPRSLVWIA